MEDHILITGTFALLLLFFTFKKWALKADVFHPGFIYCLINCGIFIVYAFGPYSYNFKVGWAYYYVYVLISFMFVIGVIWGEAKGRKKIIKDIKLSRLQLWLIYLTLLALLTVQLVGLIGTSGISIESGVDRRVEMLEQGQTKLNIANFIITIIKDTFIRLSSIIVSAYSVFQRKRYWQIALLFLLFTVNSVLINSRTLFVLGLVSIFITVYSVLKEQGVIDLSQVKWSKNFKYTVPIAVLTIFLIGAMTNVRSAIIASDYSVPYEYIESITELKRKDWFNEFANSQPLALVNPIAEISIYAGSTVAHGGLVADISMDSNLKTWGLRNFFAVHRILFQLGLDVGISSNAVHNYYILIEKAEAYLPFIKYSWWGFPANLIVDFGYLGSPLASLFTGWLIGWIYGCVSRGIIILKSITYALLFISILLTPALGPFSDFVGFITFSLLICYFLMKSVKIKYQQLN